MGLSKRSPDKSGSLPGGKILIPAVNRNKNFIAGEDKISLGTLAAGEPFWSGERVCTRQEPDEGKDVLVLLTTYVELSLALSEHCHGERACLQGRDVTLNIPG